MNKTLYNQLKELKPQLEKKYKLKRMRLFGSHAREDFREDSDVDLIVEFSDKITYFTLAQMQRELEEYLNKEVDFVFENKIFPRLRQSILEDAKDV